MRRLNGEAITDDEFTENPEWFKRVMVGGMSIIGIAALSNKIGGPVGKAINLSIHNQTEDYIKLLGEQGQDMMADGFTGNISDFKHVINVDGEDFTPGEIPSKQQLLESTSQMFDMTESSVSLVNDIKRREQGIAKMIQSARDGEALYDQLTILYGRLPNNLVKNVDKDLLVGANVNMQVISAIQLDTLNRFTTNGLTSGADIDGENFFDFQEIDMSNLEYKDVVAISKRHDDLIKSNKRYAELYSEQVDKMVKSVRSNVIKNSAVDNKKFMALSNNALLNPQSYGDVGNLLSEVSNNHISMVNHSVDLFSSKAKMSKAAVQNKISNAMSNTVIDKAIKNTPDFFKYQGQLNKIASKLQSLADNDKTGRINEVSIRYKDFSSSRGNKSYFEIKIGLEIDGIQKGQVTDNVVALIPIENENGILPSMSGPETRGYANLSTVDTSSKIKDPRSAGTTMRYLSSFNRTLETNIMNEVISSDKNDLHDANKKLTRSLRNIQDALAIVEGEGRDIYKTNSVRLQIDEDLRMLSDKGRVSKLADYKSGIQSFMNLSRANELGADAKVITLDLETIQLLGQSSPDAMPMRKTTGIWSAGMTIGNGAGQHFDVIEFSNDHVLKEHNLTRFTRGTDAQNLAAIQQAIPEDKALREFAKYARDSMEVKDGDLGSAIQQFIKTVQSKSSASKMGNVQNTEEFANLIIKQIKQIATKSKQPVYLKWANGKNFDGHLLQTITANFNELKKYVQFIDVTDISRTLNAGALDKSSDKLSSIAERHVLDAFPDLQGQISFEGSTNLRKSLKILSNPKYGLLPAHGGKTGLDYLDKALGGQAMQAHTSAATDTLLTDVASRAMLHSFEQDASFERKLGYMGNVLYEYGKNHYDKAGSDYMEMAGLSVFGTQGTYAGMAQGQTLKHTVSLINPGAVNPFWSINPLTKQLHQYDRHGYIRKRNNTPGYRYNTAMSSSIAEEMSQMAYRTVDMDKNRFANKLTMRTVFTIGAHGTQEGHAGLLQHVNKELQNSFAVPVFAKMSASSMNIQDAGIHSEIFKFYTESLAEAKKDLAAGGQWKMGDPISKDYLEQRMKEKLAAKMEKGQGLSLNPNNPVHKKMFIGPSELKIADGYMADIVGIKLQADAYDDSASNLILQMHKRASITDGAILNSHQGKSVMDVHHVSQDLLEKASNKAGHGIPELSVPLEAVSKGYHGTLKEVAFENVVFSANEILKDSKPNSKEYVAAEKALKEVAGLMKPVGGANIITESNGNRVIKMKDALSDMSPHQITAGASSIALSDILKSYSTLGHDMVWDYDSMKSYYNMFAGQGARGGGDILRNRKSLNKFLVAESEEAFGTASDQYASAREAMEKSKQNYREVADPIAMVKKELQKKKGYKETDLQKFFQQDERTISKFINGMKLPKFFQEVVDTNAMQIDGEYHSSFGIVGLKNHTIAGAGSKVTWQTNKDIPIRHAYFDNTLSSPYVSKHDKDILRSSQGYKVSHKYNDVTTAFRHTMDALQNNTLSDLTKDELSLDQLGSIIQRDETKRKILKKIDALEKSKVSKNYVKELEAILLSMEKDGNLISAKQRETIISEKISKQAEMLRNAMDNPRQISSSEAYKVTQLGREGSQVGFLPGLKKGQEFKIDLEAYADDVNKKNIQGNPLDIDTIRDFVTAQKKKLQAMKNYDPKNMLMDISDDGRHLTMNGFALPLFKDVSNVFNRTGGEMGNDFGRRSDVYKLQEAFFDSYMAMTQAVRDGNQPGEAANHEVFTNWSKMIANGMKMDKDSAFNAGTQTSIVQGVRAHYNVTDNIVTRARSVLEGIQGKNQYQADRLKSLFANMSEDRIMNFKKHVEFIATEANMTTTMVSAADVFNDSVNMNLGGGQTMTFADMKAGASKNFGNELDKVAKGLATIPGMATRFPIEPSAQLGLLQTNILGLSEDFMKFEGIAKGRLYMNSVLGAMQKADTDGDETTLILNGFRTLENLNQYRKQVAGVHDKLFKYEDMGMAIDKYNQKGMVISTNNTADGMTYKVGQLAANGTLDVQTYNAEDYFKKFDKSDYLTNLQGIGGDAFAKMDNLHKLNHGVERHMQDAAIGVYSSSSIGLITNTMRERVRDLTVLKKVAPGAADWQGLFGTIEAGFGAMTQLSIKMGKHGTTVEDAHRLTEVAKYMSNPTTMDMDAHQQAKDLFTKYYAGDKYKKKRDDMARGFEGYITGVTELKKLGSDNPELGRYRQMETDIALGRNNANIFQASYVDLIDKDEMISKAMKLSEASMKEMQAMIGKIGGQIDESFDLNRVRASAGGYMSDAAKKFARFSTDDILSNNVVKRGGKFAAFGALAIMSMNMFTPMIGTSVGEISSKNNFIGTEMELDRRKSMDSVNASFSKEAFAYLNDYDQSKYKKGKSDILGGMLDNSIFQTQQNEKVFRNKVDVNRYNRMGYIGPFGSSEYTRGL